MSRQTVWTPTHTNRAIYDEIKARAQTMRQNPTSAEKALWQRLRRKQLMGFRFRRQQPIDRFIVDFYCREAGLVVEVDGPVHDAPEHKEYDAQRSRFLQERGLVILRFQNDQVLYDRESVLQDIARFLSRIDKSPEKRKRCLGMTTFPPLIRGDRGG